MNPNIFSDEDFPLERELPSANIQSLEINEISSNVLHDIAPLPTLTKSGFKRMHSEVWTSTPKKAELDEKRRKQEERLQKTMKIKETTKKAVNKPKIRLFESSYSEIDSPNDDELCQESGESELSETDDSETNDINTASNKFSLELKPQNINVGDYILVKVSNEKTNKNYPSVVLQVHESAATVRFMRQYRGQWNVYVFPLIEDKGYIMSEDVIGKLTKFQELRYGRIKFN